VIEKMRRKKKMEKIQTRVTKARKKTENMKSVKRTGKKEGKGQKRMEKKEQLWEKQKRREEKMQQDCCLPHFFLLLPLFQNLHSYIYLIQPFLGGVQAESTSRL
jgi:DNA segregation ATPase FtsK/SpoIIIE-like protein